MPKSKGRKLRRSGAPRLSGKALKSAADAAVASGVPLSAPKSRLSGADLSGYALPGADLSRSTLYRLKLKNADLSGSDLSRSKIFYTSLAGANLSGAKLQGAELRNMSLSGANLSGANLTDAYLKDVDLQNANIDGSVFRPKEASRVKTGGMTGTPSLTSSDFQLTNGYLLGPRADLRGANLEGQDLSGLDLIYANFNKANLKNAVFNKTRLMFAHMSEANVDGADFSGADLSTVQSRRLKGRPRSLPRGYRLTGGAFFGPGKRTVDGVIRNADLSGMDLSTAGFSHVILKRPNLDGTILPRPGKIRGAIFSEVRGTPAPDRYYKVIKGFLVGPGAMVAGADFRGFDFGELDLTESKFIMVDLDGADLSGCVLDRAGWSRIAGKPKALPPGWALVKAPSRVRVYDELPPAATEGDGESFESAVRESMNESAHKLGYDGILVRADSPEAVSEHYAIEPPTNNDKFQRWFGQSKASTKGRPIVLYHGTARGGFTAFDLTRIDPHHPGFYFSNDIRLSNTYVGENQPIPDPLAFLLDPAGPRAPDGRVDTSLVDRDRRRGIYRVFLSLQNPYIYRGQGEEWSDLKDPRFPKARRTAELAAEAKKAGYDGVIFYNIVDDGGNTNWRETSDVYVAFYPTQIKSALFNSGEFSPTDPDIRKNPRRTSRRPARKTSRRARRTSRI